MIKLRLFQLFVLSSFFIFSPTSITSLIAQDGISVIPGAKGFAMNTPAGRGGTIYRVTNLNDSGTGSLRAAIEAAGPRVVIFEISGTIVLRKPIDIKNPYITIAGQTAPSPGILIRGSLWIFTHDVLVQHLSIRPGRNGVYTDALSMGADGGRPTDVVLDHLSLAWSTDEAIEVVEGTDDMRISFRNCLITESITPVSGINESYGHLMYGDGSVDIQGCFYSNHGQRTPLSSISKFAFINNLCYNRYQRFTMLESENNGFTQNIIIGNVYQDGPIMPDWVDEKPVLVPDQGLNDGSEIFLLDNIWDGRELSDPTEIISGAYESYLVDFPSFDIDGLLPMPAQEVADYVVSNAGARPADRLELDKRAINNYLNGEGNNFLAIAQVGGWPEVEVSRRSLTSPEDPDGDENGNGYTNLEEWLHEFSSLVETGKSTNTDYDLSRRKKFLPYPNPVADFLYINESEQIKSIKLYNRWGQRIYASERLSPSLDLRKLGAGMYILSLENWGGEVEHFRILKN